MKWLVRMAAIAVTAVAVTGSVRADLIGSLVSGSMQFNGAGPNYFDPVNGRVPAVGYLNFSGPSNILISGSQSEFGYSFSGTTIAADFGSNTLSLTAISGGSIAPTTFVFTDSAFNGLVLSTSSDTFPGGLTASLSGNTLTINTPNITFLGMYSSVLTLLPAAAVPEPSQYAMLGISCGFAALLAARRRGK